MECNFSPSGAWSSIGQFGVIDTLLPENITGYYMYWYVLFLEHGRINGWEFPKKMCYLNNYQIFNCYLLGNLTHPDGIPVSGWNSIFRMEFRFPDGMAFSGWNCICQMEFHFPNGISVSGWNSISRFPFSVMKTFWLKLPFCQLFGKTGHPDGIPVPGWNFKKNPKSEFYQNYENFWSKLPFGQLLGKPGHPDGIPVSGSDWNFQKNPVSDGIADSSNEMDFWHSRLHFISCSKSLQHLSFVFRSPKIFPHPFPPEHLSYLWNHWNGPPLLENLCNVYLLKARGGGIGFYIYTSVRALLLEDRESCICHIQKARWKDETTKMDRMNISLCHISL